MKIRGKARSLLALGAIAAGITLAPHETFAHSSAAQAERHHTSVPIHNALFTVHSDSKHPLMKGGKARFAVHHWGGLQCVPFARAASGIELKGNAANWWDAAAGVYERGSRPEIGSVMNFRANGHMALGHVAVVTAVVDPRTVEIEHANWASGGSKGNISRGVSVIDVSERNDWSAVRVALGRNGEYGSVYPTYGFIYDRPDNGTMVANDTGAARPAAFASSGSRPQEEVAELPPTGSFTPRARPASAINLDVPDRSIR